MRKVFTLFFVIALQISYIAPSAAAAPVPGEIGVGKHERRQFLVNLIDHVFSQIDLSEERAARYQEKLLKIVSKDLMAQQKLEAWADYFDSETFANLSDFAQKAKKMEVRLRIEKAVEDGFFEEQVN